jgi:hypothetical protein
MIDKITVKIDVEFLEKECKEHIEAIRKEAFENGYWYATEGNYPDMTYQENADQAYSEWVNNIKIMIKINGEQER